MKQLLCAYRLEGALKPRFHKPIRQSGASLLEVLVAVLLVSVGLLGVAGLSGATFAYNKNSQIRLVGMGLVNDYADRARVNVYGYDLDNYNIAINAALPAKVTFTETNANNDTDNAAAAALVAQYDKRDFLEAVAARLPQGTAVVSSTKDNQTRSMDVWLLWQEPQDEENPLFVAGKDNCPPSVKDDEALSKVYSCLYFKVGL